MKIAVIGAGGVGGYFGAKMASAGFDVTFIARGEHLHAISSNGLLVRSADGDFIVKPAKASDNLTAIKDADLIILGIKAWQVAGIARELKPLIGASATILPLQNGVMACSELCDVLDEHHVLGGLCRIFSKIEAPGIIAHMGTEPAIIFGEMNNVQSNRTLEIRSLLEQSGIKARIAEDIQAELWKKFINICASGLLAITRSTYGEIRETRETRDLMTELFEEIYALSQKMGIHIHHEFVAKSIDYVDTFAYNATSSLTRDVWEGKPSEIEYQNGSVVRLGEQFGIATPVNRFIYHCILPMEMRARKIHPEPKIQIKK